MTTAAAGYRLGLLGRKVGMMRVFTDDGDAVPVTVLDVSNNRVTQVKTDETDGYTAVPNRGKPAADGPRYKALGNSWAVPNVRWIGARINAVQALIDAAQEVAA